MNYDCPECGSSRTKALSLVFAGGTTNIRYNSFYLGTRRNFGYVPTFGRRQSIKARMAAPPRRREWTLLGWLFLMGLATAIAYVVFTGYDVDISGKYYVLGWLGSSAALGVWHHIWARSYNQTVWAAEWNRWTRSYLCERCGCIFQLGDSASSNFDEQYLGTVSIQTLEARVKRGDSKARLELAERYEFGVGIGEDCVKAAELYSAGARLGDAEAKRSLENLYTAASQEELRKLAAAGYAEAEAELASQTYYETLDPSEEEKAECVRGCRAAAEYGSAKAMGLLAHLYSVGYGVSEDFAEAKRWSEAAIALGNETAKSTLDYIDQQ